MASVLRAITAARGVDLQEQENYRPDGVERRSLFRRVFGGRLLGQDDAEEVRWEDEAEETAVHDTGAVEALLKDEQERAAAPAREPRLTAFA